MVKERFRTTYWCNHCKKPIDNDLCQTCGCKWEIAGYPNDTNDNVVVIDKWVEHEPKWYHIFLLTWGHWEYDRPKDPRKLEL
jgi:hypothetical protein